MNTPPRDSNGEYNSIPLVPGVGNGSNMPLLVPENNSVENISDQLISNIYANYDITDNITLNISAGVEKLILPIVTINMVLLVPPKRLLKINKDFVFRIPID